MIKEYICADCSRKCTAIRSENQGSGFCKCGINPIVSLAKPHFGEEPCISGTNGSGTVFFSGCSLKCVFCQNYTISHKLNGKLITIEKLANVFKQLEHKNVHNINLVNPTHYTYSIGKAFEIYRPNIPVVYNTNSYENTKTIQAASEWTDVFLADLKLLSPSRCKRYLGAENYFSAANNAIDAMLNAKPENAYENGVITRGVIIRILVLPCNIDETYKICDHIKKTWGTGVTISLMSQYYPAGLVSDTEYNEINRGLTAREYEKACDYFISNGFNNGFYQQITKPNGDMTPIFNCEGVECD